ncbi:7-cyano-7-deazaguanine synthase, partial [Candidatus Pacearchaeota archaeon]|nr:7-cyano-7-deazaguanine synthase [Candidatus Pacearchaeota archaeon]
MEKCIVMLSGGLDSRLAVKIMQEKGYDVLAVHFNLPFGTGCCDRNCSFNFTQMEGVKLKIFDCSRGKLLKDYLNCIREAKFGTGAGVNPCIDCRIFMFKEVKKFADKEKINLVVTGEVLGQRPMSQMKSSMELIERKSGLT